MSLLTASELRESPLYTQMYETRKKMSQKQREETQNKESSKVWSYPFSSEVDYSIWIDREFRTNIIQLANKYVLDNYLKWLAEGRVDSADLHEDGLMDAVRGIKNAVKKAFSSASKILSVGKNVNDRNSKDWDSFVEEATGVNLSLFDPNADKYVQEWADLNEEYLKGLSDEYANNVSQIVSNGVSNNLTKSTIALQISDAAKKFRGVFGEDNVQKRSERIARDQVGKLNSALSRSRMSQAKVDVYKWSTSADERVRGAPGGVYPNTRYSHYIMDNKYKQVDNSRKISDNGKRWRNVRGREEPRHAGQAINCRCVMIPSFIRLKNAVDSDIKRNVS